MICLARQLVLFCFGRVDFSKDSTQCFKMYDIVYPKSCSSIFFLAL